MGACTFDFYGSAEHAKTNGFGLIVNGGINAGVV
tara:strand:+ start:371 stop:472 length:102 start_codon:yes stop_codon:yes gene_type:complete